MENKSSIKHWAKDDRPREKLIESGVDALSHSELLAILIHNGTRQKSALDLAREILKLGNNNLNELGKLSLKELMSIKGIGEAKAVTIAAALELGRRRQSGEALQRDVIASSKNLANFFREKLKDFQHEVFAVVYLNQSNKVIGFEIVHEGGITMTVVDTRIILKKALEKNAVKIAVSHNHPSGSLQPSAADKSLTEKIKQAAKLIDIEMVDHIIVSETGYYSFADSDPMY
jgi:DNA repair protein RadC